MWMNLPPNILTQLEPAVTPMFISLISAWAAQLRSSENTVLAYVGDIKQALLFLSQHQGNRITIKDFCGFRAAEWRAWLTDRIRRGVKHRSNKRALAGLRSFNNFLFKNEGKQCAALNDIELPKTPKSLPRPIPLEKTLPLLDTALHEEPWINARNKALFYLLYGCGLRISEALQLNGDTLPLGDSIKVLGKGNKERYVPLLPKVKEAVEAYVSICPYPMENNQPLFRGAKGGRLYPQAASAIIRKLRGLLGLSDSATPHALRHSFASHMLASTDDLRAIQKLMGHSSLNSTQVYLEIDSTALRHTIENLHPRARGK